MKRLHHRKNNVLTLFSADKIARSGTSEPMIKKTQQGPNKKVAYNVGSFLTTIESGVRRFMIFVNTGKRFG
jgi:hypothetical protein